jgi:hypothetical protein
LRKNKRAKPFKAAVEVVSRIPECLTSLFCDFPKTIALGKMKFEGCLLVWSQFPPEPLNQRSGRQLVNQKRIVLVPKLLFVQLVGLIVLSECQVLPSVHGTVVGDLDDPGGGGPPARVKELGLLKHQKEDLLAQIFSLGRISQDAPCDIQHRAAVLAKEQGQSILRTKNNSTQQFLIGYGIEGRRYRDVRFLLADKSPRLLCI